MEANIISRMRQRTLPRVNTIDVRKERKESVLRDAVNDYGAYTGAFTESARSKAWRDRESGLVVMGS